MPTLAGFLPLDLRIPVSCCVYCETAKPCLQELGEGLSVTPVNWVRSESLAFEEPPSLLKSQDLRSSQTLTVRAEIGSQRESGDKKVAAPLVRGLFPGRN